MSSFIENMTVSTAQDGQKVVRGPTIEKSVIFDDKRWPYMEYAQEAGRAKE